MRKSVPTSRRSRRGVALVAALVALAMVSAVMAMVGRHMVTNRRLAERRQHQLQAAALARAGVELAVARLLTAPDKYTGESVAPIPGSQVRVTVESEQGSRDRFRVVSEASYPKETRNRVVRSVTCRLRRVTDGERVRIEVLPVEKPGSR